MNGFEKHGIVHTSASSINMWTGSQGAWVAKYLYKKKFPFSNPARAGVLAESAVVSVLRGVNTAEEAIKKAEADYHRATLFDKSDTTIKRGEAIRGFVENLLVELTPYGEPDFEENGEQKKLSIMCKGDGWELPIIGFVDLIYEKKNLIIDIKTTMAAPSKMSDEHARQCALYETAFGMKTKFLYATPKKTVWLECEDTRPVLSEIKAILNRQEKMLRLHDKDTLLSVVDVQPSSFYWGGAEQLRQELFSI